jgi:hypothetical protein
MKMHLLLDSDSLCYQAGFSANEPGQEAIACHQVDDIVTRIIGEVGPATFQLFLTGSDNFRYQIYPDYKGNRKDMKRPIHLQAMREFLVSHWDTVVSDGVEADDTIGIANYNLRADRSIVIGHIDKDLNMLAGSHYNYNKKTWYEVSDMDAMRHFFYQLIMGDKADNIPGYDGKMRDKVPKFLADNVEYLFQTEDVGEMLEHVFHMYDDNFERMKLSADCLWLWRKENDKWENWMPAQTLDFLMEVHGQKEDGIRSSLLSSEGEADGGPLSSPF